MEQLNNNEYNILVVEDDKEIRDGIEIFLKSQGYHVYKAADGVEGLEVIERENIHLAIVDIMMPRMDGVTMTIKLREHHEFPVIMLSAKSEETDKVIGLNIGADDYVTKPFGMMELISRIKAVLRRSGKQQDKTKLSVGGISLDTKKHEVKVDGENAVLTLKEFELLEKLMRNQGIVLTRDQLLTEIWGYDFDGETRTVDMHIRTLRQKLGKYSELIETVRNVGYRMEVGNK